MSDQTEPTIDKTDDPWIDAYLAFRGAVLNGEFETVAGRCLIPGVHLLPKNDIAVPSIHDAQREPRPEHRAQRAARRESSSCPAVG